MLVNFASGQLCNGSLGDPVVKMDFGKGAGTGPSLKAASTGYSFVSTDCPNDGFYTVNNFTTNCFTSTWHSLSEDHTPGDQGGYFMLVNASFTPGDFYVDTVQGLCSNTTYEFASWVINVLKPGGTCGNGIDPDLTFSIETTTGTVLAKQSSGNIPESAFPSWKQYGVFFKTPVGVSRVVVRITNNAPGGCGNDLALDDITFRPCGAPVTAALTYNGKDSAILCIGDNSTLTMTANYAGGYSDPVFQWQESKDSGTTWNNLPGAVGLSYTRPPTAGTGSYRYKMLIGESATFATASCRTASNVISIDIFPLPVLNFSSSVSGCENSSFELKVSGGQTYSWTGPAGFVSNQSTLVFSPLRFNNAGTYSVIARSDKGCVNDGSTSLSVLPSVLATVSPTANICEGSSVPLVATGGNAYQWIPSKALSDPFSSSPTATPTDSTRYTVIVKNNFGCADTAQVDVNVWKKPFADAGPDKRTKVGAPVQLDGTARGSDVRYFWTPSTNLSNALSLTPIGNPPQTTRYTLHVVSNVGCGTSTDDMTLNVYEIPNAFSPNGDGTNDLWAFKSPAAFEGAVVEVFNRYGQIVFRSRGYSKPWDGNMNGQPVPPGTYYYVVDFRSTTESNITGWVFVVR